GRVGHQGGGADALPGNGPQPEPQPVRAESQEIVVVAPDLAGLDANTGVVETPQGRHSLREEPELDLFGDLEFVRGAALGFQFFRGRTTLRLDRPPYFVTPHQRTAVPSN